MQVVFGGNLLRGLCPLDRLKGDPGLELRAVVSSLLVIVSMVWFLPQRHHLKLTFPLAPFYRASSPRTHRGHQKLFMDSAVNACQHLRCINQCDFSAAGLQQWRATAKN